MRYDQQKNHKKRRRSKHGINSRQVIDNVNGVNDPGINTADAVVTVTDAGNSNTISGCLKFVNSMATMN